MKIDDDETITRGGARCASRESAMMREMGGRVDDFSVFLFPGEDEEEEEKEGLVSFFS